MGLTGRIAVIVAVLVSAFAPAWGDGGATVKRAEPVSKEPATKTPAIKERVVMGWLESIFVKPWNRRLTAKLDTGAKTSSLHADKIEHFKKDGEPWVRFSLVDLEDRSQAPVRVEKPLLRTAYIKSHQHEPSKRDVVVMTICKNGREYNAEFNLVDRSNFNYPVLLGRSFLKDVALVDANTTFLFKAEADSCVPGTSAPRR